jgi:hypothetical protein
VKIQPHDAAVTASREPRASGRGVVLLFPDAKGDLESSQDRTDEHMRIPLPSL